MKFEEKKALAERIEKAEALVLITQNDRVVLDPTIIRELIDLLRKPL